MRAVAAFLLLGLASEVAADSIFLKCISKEESKQHFFGLFENPNTAYYEYIPKTALCWLGQQGDSLENKFPNDSTDCDMYISEDKYQLKFFYNMTKNFPNNPKIDGKDQGYVVLLGKLNLVMTVEGVYITKTNEFVHKEENKPSISFCEIAKPLL
ncbi:hypothetical protein N9412_00260 [bacterium]|nr:hypothetical protein [bacterium]